MSVSTSHLWSETWRRRVGIAERTEKIRKRYRNGATEIGNPRNDKALKNQGFVVHKMAEAMGFELMDLLQSTVFKTDIQSH